jgi:hypothetical protein
MDCNLFVSGATFNKNKGNLHTQRLKLNLEGFKQFEKFYTDKNMISIQTFRYR